MDQQVTQGFTEHKLPVDEEIDPFMVHCCK